MWDTGRSATKGISFYLPYIRVYIDRWIGFNLKEYISWKAVFSMRVMGGGTTVFGVIVFWCLRERGVNA